MLGIRFRRVGGSEEPSGLKIAPDSEFRARDPPKANSEHTYTPGGFEPRSLDSESRVLTVTPRGQLNRAAPARGRLARCDQRARGGGRSDSHASSFLVMPLPTSGADCTRGRLARQWNDSSGARCPFGGYNGPPRGVRTPPSSTRGGAGMAHGQEMLPGCLRATVQSTESKHLAAGRAGTLARE